jgi:hypothetical protein
MSYTPQVGDESRSPHWERGEVVRVTAIGERAFLAVDIRGKEMSYALDSPWVEPVVYPERWINIFADFTSGTAVDRAHADRLHRNFYVDSQRLGVLHLRPDGTTEMETP